jgi:hypothetical protein
MRLDPDHCAFVQSGVSIDVAGRDAHNVPAIGRALGCRVSPDRGRVTVFVSRRRSGRLLNAVASTRAVGVIFCYAGTHRALQLKGSDAEVVAVTADDLAQCRAATAAFVSNIVALGYTEERARAEVNAPEHDLVGVSFQVESAFVQTPGPAAGARI